MHDMVPKELLDDWICHGSAIRIKHKSDWDRVVSENWSLHSMYLDLDGLWWSSHDCRGAVKEYRSFSSAMSCDVAKLSDNRIELR